MAALAPVRVYAARLRTNTEFARRMRSGVGRYLTVGDVLARKPRRIGDLLVATAGLRIAGVDRYGDFVFAGRGDGGSQCPVAYFVDGFPLEGLHEIDSFAPPSAIGGIEIYPDESSVQAEYQVRAGGCAAVLVWTKDNVY